MTISTAAVRWFCLVGLLGSMAQAADQPLTLDVWPANPPGQTQQAQEQWQKKRVTHVTHVHRAGE